VHTHAETTEHGDFKDGLNHFSSFVIKTM